MIWTHIGKACFTFRLLVYRSICVLRCERTEDVALLRACKMCDTSTEQIRLIPILIRPVHAHLVSRRAFPAPALLSVRSNPCRSTSYERYADSWNSLYSIKPRINLFMLVRSLQTLLYCSARRCACGRLSLTHTSWCRVDRFRPKPEGPSSSAATGEVDLR